MARREDYEEYFDDEYEIYGSGKKVVVKEDKPLWVDILSFISTWFIRLGVVIAIILFIYYVITLKVGKAFLLLLGLAVAFGFGYLFMYCLDWLTTNN